MSAILRIFFCLLIGSSISVSAKAPSPSAEIDMRLTWGNDLLKLNQPLICGHDTLIIETLRFYISTIEILKDETVVFKEKESYHLIDAEDPSSLLLILSKGAIESGDRLRLTIGIDSTTNVSGAIGGDLDPTKGMYWTWQSGYINFKLEGKYISERKKGKDFILHLGGYTFPYNTVQAVTIKRSPMNPFVITMDMKKFMETVQTEDNLHIMSPGKQSFELAKLLPELLLNEK